MTRPRPRPDLDDLRVYSSSDTRGGRVLLHANENPYPLSERLMGEIADRVRSLELNRYPDPQASELVGLLAAYAGVDASGIWFGDGSNEVLLQLCLAYGGPGRSALLFEPTYSMHHRQARAAGTTVITERRRADFSLDRDDALAAIDRHRPDVVFVCSPNNPTGTVTPIATIAAIADAAPGLVIVDEAYHEFAGGTFVPELPRFANVVISRTLSKAFRLAGVRLGYAIGDADVLRELGRVRMPYSLSALAQAAACVVLTHRDEVLSHVDELMAERDRIERELRSIEGVEAFASGANFVLMRHARASELAAGLARRGIVVRDFSGSPGTEDCLRVTAGTPDENDAFLGALRELVASGG